MIAPVPIDVDAPQVAPDKVFFAARRSARVAFDFEASAAVDLRVQFVLWRTRRVKRTYLLGAARPGRRVRLRWDGLTSRGRAAPDGRYRVQVLGPDGRKRRLGAVSLYGHFFPVRGPHWTRGASGEFGAPRRLGDHTHDGFDIAAACGVPVVAARGGRVKRNIYDPVRYGYLVVIRGRKSNRDYWYSHLRRRPQLRRGDRVRTGQRLGRVGDTGNARTVGCHLHFEIRPRGRPVDPKPALRRWDRWS